MVSKPLCLRRTGREGSQSKAGSVWLDKGQTIFFSNIVELKTLPVITPLIGLCPLEAETAVFLLCVHVDGNVPI